MLGVSDSASFRSHSRGCWNLSRTHFMPRWKAECVSVAKRCHMSRGKVKGQRWIQRMDVMLKLRRWSAVDDHYTWAASCCGYARWMRDRHLQSCRLQMLLLLLLLLSFEAPFRSILRVASLIVRHDNRSCYAIVGYSVIPTHSFLTAVVRSRCCILVL